jgi:hypothetical protein
LQIDIDFIQVQLIKFSLITSESVPQTLMHSTQKKSIWTVRKLDAKNKILFNCSLPIFSFKIHLRSYHSFIEGPSWTNTQLTFAWIKTLLITLENQTILVKKKANNCHLFSQINSNLSNKIIHFSPYALIVIFVRMYVYTSKIQINYIQSPHNSWR